MDLDTLSALILYRNPVETSEIQLKKLHDLYGELSKQLEPYLLHYVWDLGKPIITIIDVKNDTIDDDEDNSDNFKAIKLSLEYGISLVDEWLVISILFNLTNNKDDVFIQILDAGDEVLLIEAVDVLPESLMDSSLVKNRVWVRNRNIVLIPTKFYDDGNLSIKKAIKFLDKYPFKLETNLDITNLIKTNQINYYPSYAISSLSSIILKIPREIASILIQNSKSLIGLIINELSNNISISSLSSLSSQKNVKLKHFNYSDLVDLKLNIPIYKISKLEEIINNSLIMKTITNMMISSNKSDYQQIVSAYDDDATKLGICITYGIDLLQDIERDLKNNSKIINNDEIKENNDRNQLKEELEKLGKWDEEGIKLARIKQQEEIEGLKEEEDNNNGGENKKQPELFGKFFEHITKEFEGIDFNDEDLNKSSSDDDENENNNNEEDDEITPDDFFEYFLTKELNIPQEDLDQYRSEMYQEPKASQESSETSGSTDNEDENDSQDDEIKHTNHNINGRKNIHNENANRSYNDKNFDLPDLDDLDGELPEISTIYNDMVKAGLLQDVNSSDAETIINKMKDLMCNMKSEGGIGPSSDSLYSMGISEGMDIHLKGKIKNGLEKDI